MRKKKAAEAQGEAVFIVSGGALCASASTIHRQAALTHNSCVRKERCVTEMVVAGTVGLHVSAKGCRHGRGQMRIGVAGRDKLREHG